MSAMDNHTSESSDARAKKFLADVTNIMDNLPKVSDADMPDHKKYRVRISVEGYDTSLPEEDINKALVNLFNSCGEILRVTIPVDPETCLVERRAFIILFGEGAAEKALQLNGSDMRGWNLFVKLTPEEDRETIIYRHCLYEEVLNDERFRFGVAVRGYDTSLPDDDVKSTLMKHFSSCGDITCVLTGISKVNVYFTEQDAEGKALKLDGSEVGGYKISVRLTSTVGSCPSATEPMISSCIPAHCILLAKETRKKIMAFKKKRGLV